MEILFRKKGSFFKFILLEYEWCRNAEQRINKLEKSRYHEIFYVKFKQGKFFSILACNKINIKLTEISVKKRVDIKRGSIL